VRAGGDQGKNLYVFWKIVWEATCPLGVRGTLASSSRGKSPAETAILQMVLSTGSLETARIEEGEGHSRSGSVSGETEKRRVKLDVRIMTQCSSWGGYKESAGLRPPSNGFFAKSRRIESGRGANGCPGSARTRHLFGEAREWGDHHAAGKERDGRSNPVAGRSGQDQGGSRG